MSLSVEWLEDACVVVVLDRPDKRNAVDLTMLRALSAVLADVKRRESRVMVLLGAGSAFCSGADLEGVELGEFTETLSSVLAELAALPCLTMAAIEGPALGAGMQLAAACDLRMATAESPIGVPAVKLGLAVDAWTVERIGQEAGWGTARVVLLTGEALRADSMLGGFVHRLAPAGGIRVAAQEWAMHLSALAPLSVRAHKLALAHRRGESVDAVEAARLAAWASDDAVEGRRAFRERRRPRFFGR
ncbi:MAG: enoyl-CoA hydratase-related protein [Ilumatobacteraceae bacterium]